MTVALSVAIGGLHSTAGADPVKCAKRNPLTGVCLLTTGTSGTAGTGSGTGTGTGAGTGGVPGGEVDAVNAIAAGGTQGPPDPCTYTVANPQPPASHPVWGGRTAVDGAVYLQVCARPDGYGSGYRTEFVFVAAGTEAPVGPAIGPAIDPRVLAEQAIATMTLQAPAIRTAPPPGSASGLVGLPVWLWTEQGELTTGPTRQTASAGGVTVTAVGQVSRVVWDMGDGTAVVCGAGTPYRPGATGSSPDCGHVYDRASSRHVPGGAGWPITATSTWTITWTGGGLSGTETLELSSSAELPVGELHVLNQDGGRP
jgi:hypothetical protein